MRVGWTGRKDTLRAAEQRAGVRNADWICADRADRLGVNGSAAGLYMAGVVDGDGTALAAASEPGASRRSGQARTRLACAPAATCISIGARDTVIVSILLAADTTGTRCPIGASGPWGTARAARARTAIATRAAGAGTGFCQYTDTVCADARRLDGAGIRHRYIAGVSAKAAAANPAIAGEACAARAAVGAIPAIAAVASGAAIALPAGAPVTLSTVAGIAAVAAVPATATGTARARTAGAARAADTAAADANRVNAV